MSESEEEETNFCYYGTPLDPYDEDTFPKRKPIGIEDQIATDAQGRRRFHGAFTGGFSAGFFNTVGTPEGWTPSEFKSSRADKASGKTQRPQDFMDDEDLGEFGIAPETVKATDEYSTKKKRKKQPFSTGPIPGIPVLHTLLEVHTETVGYTLMKNMGWKVADDSEDEDEPDVPDSSDGKKVYGCVIPREFRNLSKKFIIGSKALKQNNPYDEYITKPKDNSFGMGYKGLDRSIFGHVNLLEPSSFVVRDKSNKRSTVRGQAFGVGAFEREDEDIYKQDDMTKYDFTLEDIKEKKPEASKKAIAYHSKNDCPIDGFVRAKTPFVFPSTYPPPTIPHSFTGKHKVKRSRFEPVPEDLVKETEKETAKVVHNAETRREMLEDDREKRRQRRKELAEEARKKNLEMLMSTDRFVPSNASTSKTENAEKDDADVKQEQHPFFTDRFVSATKPDEPTNALVEVQRMESMHGTQDMRKAAEMKMFGPLTRIAFSWNPNPLLCKRFNVPLPLFDGYAEKKKQSEKRSKLLVFEYQKAQEAESDLKPGLTEIKVPKPEEEKVEENQETETNVAEGVVEIAATNDSESVQDTSNKNSIVEEKEEISPEKNMDLFKAVFLSSSSEDEQSDHNEEEEKDKKQKEETHKEIITKEIEEITLPKIAPRKTGILSNITFTKPQPLKQEPDILIAAPAENVENKANRRTETDRSNLYGPQLPANIINKPPKIALCASTSRTFSISSSRTSSKSSEDDEDEEDDDEWIEKKDNNGSTNSSSSKSHKRKKKKHKKEHDRKKHKSNKHKKHKKDKR